MGISTPFEFRIRHYRLFGFQAHVTESRDALVCIGSGTLWRRRLTWGVLAETPGQSLVLDGCWLEGCCLTEFIKDISSFQLWLGALRVKRRAKSIRVYPVGQGNMPLMDQCAVGGKNPSRILDGFWKFLSSRLFQPYSKRRIALDWRRKSLMHLDSTNNSLFPIHLDSDRRLCLRGRSQKTNPILGRHEANRWMHKCARSMNLSRGMYSSFVAQSFPHLRLSFNALVLRA